MTMEKISKGHYKVGQYEIFHARKWNVYSGEEFLGMFKTLEDALVAIERHEER